MSLRQTFEQAWAEVTARATCVVQDKEELFTLIALLHGRGVRSYLELGASEGVSLFCIGMCLPVGSTIHVVDLGEAHSEPHLKRNIKLLCQAGQKVFYQKATTVNAHGYYVGLELDALLIDAGHGYQQVKEDWELYGTLAKLVAFHDIRLGGPARLWQEIGGGLEIHNDRRKPMGFGIKFNE